MPVRIPNLLPAKKVLEGEGIFVMTDERAMHQDIRPLRIAVLNLMPTKIVTETQILRLLGNTPLQIDVRFIHMENHDSKNTPEEHLDAFYVGSREVLDENYDGLVITGAPVETLPFEQVDYWDDLVKIMDWSRKRVWSTLHICWAAQAGLYHHFGVPKYPLAKKLSGLYSHTLLDTTAGIGRGFDERFYAPHSRHTEVREADILKSGNLKLISVSDEAGVYIVSSSDGRQVFVTGHPEYDRLTLKAEYERDLSRGLGPAVPANYFPGDDPSKEPVVSWRAHANLLYANWLNYHVYQSTPFELGAIPEL